MTNKYASNRLSAYYILTMMKADKYNDWISLYDLAEYLNCQSGTETFLLAQSMMILEEFELVIMREFGASVEYKLARKGMDFDMINS